MAIIPINSSKSARQNPPVADNFTDCERVELIFVKFPMDTHMSIRQAYTIFANIFKFLIKKKYVDL